MQYLLQAILIAVFFTAERYVTKWATHKIDEKAPYRSGIYFMTHELTGEKAAFMHKVNIIAVRVTILITLMSIIVTGVST